MIGNDVVDLQFFESPAYHHVGYLNRVCTPAEARFVLQSDDPSTVLAMVWASKEAAYKAVSKRISCPYFVAREFETHFEKCPTQICSAELAVSHCGIQSIVKIMGTERWIHAIARLPEAGTFRWTVCEIKNCFAHNSAAKSESEAVRFLAKELFVECRLPDVALEFVERIPTVVRTAGGSAGVEISLSHHGAFAAAAVAYDVKARGLLMDFGEKSKEHLPVERLCFTSTA